MSNLVLYKRPLNALNLFDDAFSDLFDGYWHRDFAPAFNPRAEVTEHEKEFRLALEVPGMKREDIHAEVKDGTLRLWGERKAYAKKEKENVCYSERSYGSFERTFQLPENVAADRIDAKYNNGILELTIPKTEEVKPKAIEVKIA